MTFRRPASAAAALCLALLAAAGCGQRPAAPAPPAPTSPFVAEDWAYPGASEVSSVGPSDVTADVRPGETLPRVVDRTPGHYVSTTPDPIGTVFAFYVAKLGIEAGYQPGTTTSARNAPVTLTDTRKGVSAMLTGSLVHHGRSDREGVRTATLVRHDPGGDVVVILSRGDGEAVTTIEVLPLLGPDA